MYLYINIFVLSILISQFNPIMLEKWMVPNNLMGTQNTCCSSSKCNFFEREIYTTIHTRMTPHWAYFLFYLFSLTRKWSSWNWETLAASVLESFQMNKPYGGACCTMKLLLYISYYWSYAQAHVIEQWTWMCVCKRKRVVSSCQCIPME